MVFITKGSYGCSVSIVFIFFSLVQSVVHMLASFLYVLILMQYFIFQHFFSKFFFCYTRSAEFNMYVFMKVLVFVISLMNRC